MKAAVTPTRVDFSTIESETLNLKIGRCNYDFFDENELYRQIVKSRYDLCRVKVAAEDEFAVHRMHHMGLPYFFSGSIRRYKTKIEQAPEGDYLNKDLVWEYYDGTQNQLLKDMLIGTWGTYPIGYYRTPYLSELTNKEIANALFKSVRTIETYRAEILKLTNTQNGIGLFKFASKRGIMDDHSLKAKFHSIIKL